MTLETERLVLRPRTTGDLGACVEMDADAEVVRYIPVAWDGPQEHAAFLRERIGRVYPPGLGYWAVVAKSDPAGFLGWVHLLPVDDDAAAAEIGWRLKRSAWGHGYATEAARAVLAHAFGTVGCARVVAATHADNVRSKKVVERLGMRLVGDFLYEGVVPSSAYEIVKG